MRASSTCSRPAFVSPATYCALQNGRADITDRHRSAGLSVRMQIVNTPVANRVRWVSDGRATQINNLPSRYRHHRFDYAKLVVLGPNRLLRRADWNLAPCSVVVAENHCNHGTSADLDAVNYPAPNACKTSVVVRLGFSDSVPGDDRRRQSPTTTPRRRSRRI